MSVRGPRHARVEFLAPTRDDEGRIVHHAGEVVTGEMLARNHDFLLLRASTGAWMYIDTLRTDLYLVEVSEQI